MNQEGIQSRHDGPPQNGAPVQKLVHLALPVRLTHMNSDAHGSSELACTYDIHPRGARMLSFRNVQVGDLITVERGRTKSVCRVVWTGDPKSPLRGQFTVECAEGTRTPWEDELRQMEEQYLPLLGNANHGRPNTAHNIGRREANRRRGPRFQVAGEADLAEIGGRSRVEGRLEQLSQYGCLVSASDLLTPGTGLRMVLNIYDVSLALKGAVKYTAGNSSMGVEFREIRQGDRPLLEYVLSQLKKPRRDDFADLEVITNSLAAIAG